MDSDLPMVRADLDARGVATLTLCRPRRHNALSAALIDALDSALETAERNPGARLVVLTGEGPTFCAGADIGEMRASATAPAEDNEREAARLAALLSRLDRLDRPTVARVQGNAFGGALGLIAACDIAVAASSAVFALTEVRLGILPAMISPYVVRAIGARQARRYFLTGERIDATQAERIGLLHAAVPDAELDRAVDALAGELLQGGPVAQAEAKRLVRYVSGRGEAIDQTVAEETARWIARLRAGDEGREGLAAFLDKRSPSWRGS
jgi:methylglutaconyl-CoA hydratase